MPAKKNTGRACQCGSGRPAIFACVGVFFCVDCVDGTDALPSLAEVADSPIAEAARAAHGDRAEAPRLPLPAPTGGFTVTLTETDGSPEPDDTTTALLTMPAPQGFERVRSVNGGVTTRRATPTGNVRLPSDRSLAFLRTLLAEREGDVDAEAIRDALNGHRAKGTLDQAKVSNAIDSLKRIPKPRFVTHRPMPGVPAADRYEAAEGDVHVIDGTYFRVHLSQTSGYLYGAVWNSDESKFMGAARDDRAKGSLRRMTKGTLATAEQAAAFGRMTKACCFCSRRLSTPESTAVGYGPECADKRGLPWG